MRASACRGLHGCPLTSQQGARMVHFLENKSMFVACVCARVCVFLPCVHRFDIEGNSSRINSSNSNGKFSYFPTHRCVCVSVCAVQLLLLQFRFCGLSLWETHRFHVQCGYRSIFDRMILICIHVSLETVRARASLSLSALKCASLCVCARACMRRSPRLAA